MTRVVVAFLFTKKTVKTPVRGTIIFIKIAILLAVISLGPQTTNS